MTVPAAPQRYSGSERIDDLVREFARPGQDCTPIPLSQVELAQRWNINPGSVQDLLRRQQALGRVLSRSPLILATGEIAAVPERPLRLVTSPPSPSDDSSDSRSLLQDSSTQPVLSDDLVHQTLDLMITAAAAGQLEFAHQLKALATEHLSTDRTATPPPQPVGTTAGPRSVAENAARAAENAAQNAGGSRVPLEKEREKNFSSGSSNQNAGENAVQNAGLPEVVAGVVAKRLNGRSHQSDADATAPWLRPSSWQMTKPWTEKEVDDIKRFWVSANIAEQLSADALAALQLWEPATAARAITALSARTDTRNYSARIMDASIWGYHAFYPLRAGAPTSDQPEGRSAASLHSVAEVLVQFEPDALIEHLESCASRPSQLITRAALACHLNLLTSQQLDELHFIDSVDEIVTVAAEFASILEGAQT